MNFSGLMQRWRELAERPAIVCGDVVSTYEQLASAVDRWGIDLAEREIPTGHCVAIVGLPSLQMVALLVALVQRSCVVVPFVSDSKVDRDEALRTAHVDVLFDFQADGTSQLVDCGFGGEHPLLDHLRGDQAESGLILFTSGSTGKTKASVHRFSVLISNAQRKEGRPLTTIIFLMLDHIGGMNTLLHTLCNCGTAVWVGDRSVDTVCKTIERYGVELLPTTPTFLNMILISGKFRRYDLSSLRMVTYGTEPMSAATLRGLMEVLPGVRYKQTYGLTEVGILPTVSEAPGSTWMKVGGPEYETKIIDDTLWIRSKSSMLGYLNAPSPFSPEGWLNTGDQVELRDGYLRIVGRKSDIINVAGEKVYPAEVEEVVMQVDNISDVAVTGQANVVTGQLVIATVRLGITEDSESVERRVIAYCREHLPHFKVPAIVRVSSRDLYGQRFKKMRAQPLCAVSHNAMHPEMGEP